MAIRERVKDAVKISDYLQLNHISFLEAKSRNDALYQLTEVLYQSGKILDQDSFYQAILSREKLISTGIGMGVAIPHAKKSDYNNFFIAIGIQKEKGLEWNALDKTPVKLIFMIGGPENRQTEYLQILSRLTHAIKDEDLRKQLFQIDDKRQVLSLFEQF